MALKNPAFGTGFRNLNNTLNFTSRSDRKQNRFKVVSETGKNCKLYDICTFNNIHQLDLHVSGSQ